MFGVFFLESYILMMLWNWCVVWIVGWNKIGFATSCLFMFLINLLTNLASFLEHNNTGKKGE